MSQRIHESTGGLSVKDGRYRVCIIRQGSGSSANFPETFFVAENAQKLAGALSFSNHPVDLERPDFRDPLAAIGYIGENLTIEEHDGVKEIWGEYIPANSRPDVQNFLAEFHSKIGLSVYGDSDGHRDSVSGKWIAESFAAHDPYRSVDLVVAPGAGGKFENRIAESLRKINETSTPVEEKRELTMEEDVKTAFAGLSTQVGKLVEALEGKAKADLQADVDTEAVSKAVESRLADYDKAVSLISEAKLTKTQSDDLRARALKGEDIVPAIDFAKQVLAEAAKPAEDENSKQKITESHRPGASDTHTDTDFSVPGFGKVA